MFRSGKVPQTAAFALVIGGFLAFATPARANIGFFTEVMRNCQHYRVSADMVQMNLEDDGTGALTFYLTLPSRRNNFEEVILVGFVATSHAIARRGLNVTIIYVTASVSKDDDMLMTTRVDAALAEKLRLGEIRTHEFMRLIDWVQ